MRKKNAISSVLLLIGLLSGCRAYLGHSTYEQSRNLRRENEKVIAEFDRLMIRNEGISVEHVVELEFDDVCDIDTIESDAYGPRKWGLAEAIGIPIRLVFSPLSALLSVLVDDAKTEKINGHTYSRSAAQEWNNIYNIFVSFRTVPDLFENKTAATRVSWVPKNETKNQTIADAEITVTAGKRTFQLKSGKKALKTLQKQIFQKPLPPQKCNVKLTYKKAETDLQLSSLEMISKSEQKEWQNVETALNGKGSVSDLMHGIALLNKFMDKKMIALQDGTRLLATLNGMRAVRYPVGEMGIKLDKKINGGTNLRYLQEEAAVNGEKIQTGLFSAPKAVENKFPYNDRWRRVHRYLYAPAGSHDIVFGMILSLSVSSDRIIAKYKKEFPGIKVYNDRNARLVTTRKKLLDTYEGRTLYNLDKSEFERQVQVHTPERFVLENDRVYIFVREGSDILTGDANGSNTIIVIDKKYEALCAEACKKARADAAAKKKAEEEKRLDF